MASCDYHVIKNQHNYNYCIIMYNNITLGMHVCFVQIQLIDAIDQEIYRKTSWIGDSSDLGLSIKKVTTSYSQSDSFIIHVTTS